MIAYLPKRPRKSWKEDFRIAQFPGNWFVLGIIWNDFWSSTIWAILPNTYFQSKAIFPNAHAKVEKRIFDVQFPGNWFEFGIIWIDFWNSTIQVIRIWGLFSEFKNLKKPGIQPYHSSKSWNIKNYIIQIVTGTNI